jgi:hypothetical protein
MDSWFEFQKGYEVILFSKVSRKNLWSTQSLFNGNRDTFSGNEVPEA